MNRILRGMRRRDRRHWRVGAAATEFAFVLPLMLTLTFVGADFGRALHAHVALSNACRAGAEYAARNPYSLNDLDGWESRIHDVVVEELFRTPAVITDQLVTEVNIVEEADGIFRVSVEAIYPFATLVNWPGVPSEVTLHRRVCMRRYR